MFGYLAAVAVDLPCMSFRLICRLVTLWKSSLVIMPRDPLIGLVGKPSSGKSTTLNRYAKHRTKY